MNRTINILIAILLGAAACFAVLPASAQEMDTVTNDDQPIQMQDYHSPTARPAVSDPSYVAMSFYKLSGQLPDFSSWARLTPAYAAASNFDKGSVEEQEAKKLQEQYALFAVQEPLVIETPVKLSSFDPANHGFFIDNFRKDTYFPVQHGDRFYSVIVPGLIEKQYIKVPDDAAAKMIDDAATAAKDRTLVMSLMLTPLDADASGPSTVDGHDYWAILADVKKMTLFAGDAETPLWHADEVQTPSAEKSEAVIKLKQ